MDKCIRCDGELEAGFMLDKGDYGQSQWARGKPDTAFWKFSAVPSGSKTLPIVTYRCKSCGRLESFAYAAPADPD
ncbi:MAG: hypothetical protein EOP92_09680 [Lysobacteraceae bacterium]|nr:MAG: hypothetical protein EOP92_09680 [Xanthomonadaceae bacterium]